MVGNGKAAEVVNCKKQALAFFEGSDVFVAVRYWIKLRDT
jgi:hypothetical protein